MATKAKTILSSLYELGDNPCGLVCKWFTPPPRKSLTKSVLRHISTIITLSQLCSRAVAKAVIFQYSPRVK